MNASESLQMANTLVSLGALAPQDISEARQVAKDLGQPLSKILIQSGYLSQECLTAAFDAAEMVHAGTISIDVARAAYQMAIQKGITFRQALNEGTRAQQAPAQRASNPTLPKLCALMPRPASALVPPAPPKPEAKPASPFTPSQSRPPVSFTPVTSARYSQAPAPACLVQPAVQRQQMQGAAQSQQIPAAAQPAQTATINHSAFAGAPQADEDPLNQTIREVLVVSGSVDALVAENALRMARSLGMPIEKVLLGNGRLPAVAVEALTTMRELFTKSQITVVAAADVLRKMRENKISLQCALAELGLMRRSSHERIRIGELLKHAGLISARDLEYALKLSIWNDVLIGKMLVMLGLISESTLQNALRCQFLLREGNMKYDMAIIVLNYCERSRCDADQALKELAQCA